MAITKITTLHAVPKNSAHTLLSPEVFCSKIEKYYFIANFEVVQNLWYNILIRITAYEYGLFNLCKG